MIQLKDSSVYLILIKGSGAGFEIRQYSSSFLLHERKKEREKEETKLTEATDHFLRLRLRRGLEEDGTMGRIVLHRSRRSLSSQPPNCKVLIYFLLPVKKWFPSFCFLFVWFSETQCVSVSAPNVLWLCNRDVDFLTSATRVDHLKDLGIYAVSLSVCLPLTLL